MILKRESRKSIDVLPDSSIDVHWKNLDRFYKFMHKRHNIYIRRFVKKLPPPWTKDLILQKYKFTNIYRKLDRSSQWLIHKVIENDAEYPRLTDKVWASIFYRINNNTQTFDACGIPTRKQFKPDKYQQKMEEYKDKGNRVFTNAHITCQSNLKRSRIENFIEITTRLKANWKTIWSNIKQFKKENNWEDCFKFIKSQYGFGGFTSYEVCIDMVYADVFPDWIRDTFANPGPGCQYALEAIFPNRDFISHKDGMRDLTYRQESHFKRLGIKFKGPKLMIQDIEFALCEFGKYFKIKHGVGKARMRFIPTTIIDYDD